MPPTRASSGPGLAIHLEREKPNYTLPDTVVGRIIRKEPIVTSNAVLTIALFGRSKSKIVAPRLISGSVRRGRFSLVDETKHVQTLFEGPLHISQADGGKSWPFAVALPTKYDACEVAQGVPQQESFLPLVNGGSAAHTLPATFAGQKWGDGEGMGCFVEYFLHARLTTSDTKSKDAVEATMPLNISVLHDGVDLGRNQMQSSRHVQNLGKTGLKRALSSTSSDEGSPGPSKTPSNAQLAIHTQMPRSLQLDHKDPIPFSLSAEIAPNPDDSLLASNQAIIKTITVHLVAGTNIKCKSRRGVRQDGFEEKFNLITKPYDQQWNHLVIPWTANRPLNVGEPLGLKVPSELFNRITESFTTHNIQHTHRLAWTLTVQLGDQTLSVSGSEPVQLIPPSRDSAPVEYEVIENELEAEVERTRTASMPENPPEYGREEFDRPLPPRDTERRRTRGAFGLSSLWQEF